MSRLTQKGATGPLPLFQTTFENSLFSTVGSQTLTACGEMFDSSDGRSFVLVSNSTTALVAGNLIQAPAIVANHQNLTVTAFAPVSTSTNLPATVTVTLGGTAATSQQYAQGYAIVNSGTGIGQTLKIQSNPAQASTTGALVVTLEDAPVVALDTTSTICLIPNLYTNVVINPTTATNTPVGVTLYAIPASTAVSGTTPGTFYFGLIQTKGAVSCLADASTAAVGLGLIPSTTTAGTVTVATATGARIGRALQATVSAQARTIYLHL